MVLIKLDGKVTESSHLLFTNCSLLFDFLLFAIFLLLFANFYLLFTIYKRKAKCILFDDVKIKNNETIAFKEKIKTYIFGFILE